MYGARLLADMTERADHYFQRVEIPRLDSDLEQFAFDQWATVTAVQDCEMAGYYPRNTGACSSPYPCPYLEVCRGMRGDPDDQTPDGFKRASRLHGELKVQSPA